MRRFTLRVLRIFAQSIVAGGLALVRLNWELGVVSDAGSRSSGCQ